VLHQSLFQSAALWLEQIVEFWWVVPSEIHLDVTTELQSGDSHGGAFGWGIRAADQKVADSIPQGVSGIFNDVVVSGVDSDSNRNEYRWGVKAADL